MLGIQTVRLRDNYLEYTLVIERNISIVVGNSATGKTTFISMLLELQRFGARSGVKLSASCNVVLLDDRSDWDKELQRKNTLFVIDESTEYISYREFSDAFYASGNYLVIFTRSDYMRSFDYAVSSIYEFVSTKSGDLVTTTMVYKYTNTRDKIVPDVVISEDSNSGRDMFKLIFDCPVVSAKGKDNVYPKFKELSSSNHNIYMIVDGAMFGNNMFRFRRELSERIKLFAPESFEYLLLNCEPLRRRIQHILDNPSEYVDFSKYKSYEQYYTDLLVEEMQKFGFTYKKKSLIAFFKTPQFIEEFKKQLPDIFD